MKNVFYEHIAKSKFIPTRIQESSRIAIPLSTPEIIVFGVRVTNYDSNITFT
jgi:hypothetical protein